MTLIEKLRKTVDNIRQNAAKADDSEAILNSPCTSLTVSLLLEEAANELENNYNGPVIEDSWRYR